MLSLLQNLEKDFMVSLSSSSVCFVSDDARSLPLRDARKVDCRVSLSSFRVFSDSDQCGFIPAVPHVLEPRTEYFVSRVR